MAEDLILKATLDTTDVETKAKDIQQKLSGINNASVNTGDKFAQNIGRAASSAQAMLGTFSQMGGTIGAMAQALSRFTPILSQAAGAMRAQPSGGTSGSPSGITNTLSNVTGSESIVEATKKINESFSKYEQQAYEQISKETGSHLVLMDDNFQKRASEIQEDTKNAVQNVAKNLNEVARPAQTLASQFRTMAGSLSNWALGLGTLVAGIQVGLKLQKSLYETGLQKEKLASVGIDEFSKWNQDRSIARGLANGTPEGKASMLKTLIGKTGDNVDAYNEFRMNAKNPYENKFVGNSLSDTKWVEFEERKKANVARMINAGAKSGKTEDIEEWVLDQRKRLVTFKDLLEDLNKPGKEKAGKKAASLFDNPITDDITRIGGSVGGRIDYQRSMLDKLSSMDDSLLKIKQYQAPGMFSLQKNTLYI